MDKSAEMAGTPSANNSSDFVRKLYKMLEDPSYDHIVRWGEGGESFVVLENEKFTKTILPKHFKHSNFASFVRQLNKYDFHKVRQNNEDNAVSPYGANAWEFKHPEFQANKKDNLDNIRRKAPAPRKPVQNNDDAFTNQQTELLQAQLMASQQEVANLSNKFHDLAQGHVVLLQHVVSLQKGLKTHDGVMHKLLGFLQSTDAERRKGQVGGRFANGSSSGLAADPTAIVEDHLASPLQQASELLEGFSTANLPDKTLEAMTNDIGYLRNDYSTPPNEHGSAHLLPQSDASSNHLTYTIGSDLDSMVYPVGHTNGIDPVNAEHIHNIPYSLPPQMPENIVSETASETRKFAGRKKTDDDVHLQIWGINKPRVLLVEDDMLCARIGSKFLQNFECGVEIARDGLEAVNKINQAGTGPNTFNLILMDIIMPNLDGVSATVCIREILPNTPIIAMTSNIRADDIDMYFRYGMNDVLPKPFTKEGMLKALVKNLPLFLKDAQPPSQSQYQSQPQLPHPGAAFSTPNPRQAPLGLSMGQMSAPQSIKDETSPGKSPATASSWHSPNQIPGQSPIGNGPVGFMQQQPMRDHHYGAMTSTHPPSQTGFPPPPNTPLGPPRGPPHKRVMSEMTAGPDEHPDSRRRLYAQNPSSYHQ